MNASESGLVPPLTQSTPWWQTSVEASAFNQLLLDVKIARNAKAAAPHIPDSTTGPGSFKYPPAFREALPPGARSLVEWAHPASEHAASGTGDGARL